MSTALTLTKNTVLPAYAQRVMQQKGTTNTLGGSSGTTPNRLKFKQGKPFKVVNGQEAKIRGVEDGLSVIILANQPDVGRQYYDTDYDPESDTAKGPVCYSTNGKVPDAASALPQCTTCALCPMSKDGSARTGKAKACSRVQRLLVALPGDDKVYQFDVKGRTIFGQSKADEGKYNLQDYGRLLSGHGTAPGLVETIINPDDDATVNKLLFSPAGILDEETYVWSQEILEAVDAQKLLAYSGARRNDPNDGPAEKPQKQAVQTDEDDEAPAAAPVKKKPAAAKPKAPAPVLAEDLQETPLPPQRPASKFTKVAAATPEVEDDEDEAPAAPVSKFGPKAKQAEAKQAEAKPAKVKVVQHVPDDEDDMALVDDGMDAAMSWSDK